MANDDTTDQSGKRYFGIGIVAVDKPRGSDYIMVTPIEKIAMRSGRLSESEKTIEVSSQDINGTVTSDTIVAQSMIKAKWMVGDDGNRQTAPDVQEGETVDLYRYGNSNEYFWTTTYREPGLRRLETVLYCYGNLSSKGSVWDKDSSWWYEISTHDKHVRWKTTQSDGEAYAYDFHISAKTNTITIEDNIQNQWFMDSTEHLMRMRNADGSYVDLDKFRYHGFAQEHMTHESDITHMKTPLFTVCSGEEGGYHAEPFLQISARGGHAQIGSGNEAYAHFTGPDIEITSSASITEKTELKTVTNSVSVTTTDTAVEKLGNVTRTADTISETTQSTSRSSESSSDSVGERSLTAKNSKEEHGQKDEKVGELKQDINTQTSDVRDLTLTSQNQTNTSQTRTEQYETQTTTVTVRTETVGKISQEVTGPVTITVGGAYTLTTTEDIVLFSGGTVKTSDAEISNLTVPGKIVLEGNVLNEQIKDLYAITDNHEGRLGNIEDELGIQADTLKTQAGAIEENKEATSDVKSGLDQTTKKAEGTQNELDTTKEKLTEADTKIAALEQWKTEAIARFEVIEKRLEDITTKIADMDSKLATVGQTAEDAQGLAKTANDAATAAADAASEAANIASEAASAAATASAGVTAAMDAATAATDLANTAISNQNTTAPTDTGTVVDAGNGYGPVDGATV